MFQVLARGQVVEQRKHTGQWTTYVPISIPIRPEMIPSARLLVYFIKDGKVGGDSLWIDVEDACSSQVNNASSSITTHLGTVRTSTTITTTTYTTPASCSRSSSCSRSGLCHRMSII